MTENGLRPVSYLFYKLNIWLCATAALMIVASAVALSIPLRSVGTGLLLAPLLFCVIYIEDRRTASDEDWITDPKRTRIVQQYRTELLGAELLALVGYQLLLVSHILENPIRGAGYWLLGQLPFVVLAMYGSLKRYSTFDSIAVGATWAFMIVFSLVVSTGQPVTGAVFVVFVAWFVITFGGVESRNALDLDGDSAVDKTTLAGHLGATATRRLERLLKTLGVGLFWYLGGLQAAGLVVVHLFLVRVFRWRTQQAGRGELLADRAEPQ